MHQHCAMLLLMVQTEFEQILPCRFGNGVNQPLQLVVFGRLMDSFNIVDREAVKDQVLFFAGMYALLGVQQFVTVALQTACFESVAARLQSRGFVRKSAVSFA